jgi:hypothetical protein
LPGKSIPQFLQEENGNKWLSKLAVAEAAKKPIKHNGMTSLNLLES